MKLIKHRGFKSKWVKENTLEGITTSFLDPKYEGVEFDVRETSDHEFILCHNPLINNKLIKDWKFRDLPKYIPRLKDILKIRTSKIFLIEIKNITSFSKLINLLSKYATKNIYVMSFSNKIINKLNIPSKTYKVGVLNYILNTHNNLPDLDFVCILNNFLNSKLIQDLKPLEVFSYGLISSSSEYKYPQIFYIVD